MSAYVRLRCDICTEEVDAYGGSPSDLPRMVLEISEGWGMLEVGPGDDRVACPECMRTGGSGPKGGALSG